MNTKLKVKLSFCLSFVFLLICNPLFSNQIISTKDDLNEISITIYNGGFGIIKEKRNLELPKGDLEIHYMDVASKIDPTSVHFKSITSPEKVIILEQNYEYDLISPLKLLEKYVGKDVKLLMTTEQGREIWRDAQLLSINDGSVFKIDNQIYLFRGDQVILPKIPENLIAKPTLIWLVNCRNEKIHETEVTYMTEGINWKADYVAVVNHDDSGLDLDGWVTIDNRSGGEFPNAKLKLVAGDVHRVEKKRDRFDYRYAAKAMMSEAAEPQFEQRDLFEYKIYQLQRKTTIKDNQTKQMMLLSSSNIKAKKIFLIKNKNFYSYQFNDVNKIKAKVMMEFVNSKENNLGMPLPKGKVRAFKRDIDGSIEFIGEDEIDHTPKDEKLEILLGNAFDIISEKKQTNFRRMGDSTFEASYEIEIRNHKTTNVVVKVVEYIYGDWRIFDNNYKFEKKTANSIEFNIPVSPDGKAIVNYTVRVN